MFDRYDLEIIKLLESSARLSFAELAEQVGLSKTPCWNRVKALEEQGVIDSYRANLQPQNIGLSIHAMISAVVDFSRYQAFELAVVQHRNIRACHSVTGDYDYILEVLAKDMEEFDQLLKLELSQLPGVTRFTTAISTKSIKTQGAYSAML